MADAVVDFEVHSARLLEEEVALVVDLVLIILGPAVLHIESACDVTLPLDHLITSVITPARTDLPLGPCGRGGGLLGP